MTAGALGLTLSVALNSLLERWSIRSMNDPLVLAAVAGTLLVSMVAATMIPRVSRDVDRADDRASKRMSTGSHRNELAVLPAVRFCRGGETLGWRSQPDGVLFACDPFLT